VDFGLDRAKDSGLWPRSRSSPALRSDPRNALLFALSYCGMASPPGAAVAIPATAISRFGNFYLRNAACLGSGFARQHVVDVIAGAGAFGGGRWIADVVLRASRVQTPRAGRASSRLADRVHPDWVISPARAMGYVRRDARGDPFQRPLGANPA
jgi:hypothetical protein